MREVAIIGAGMTRFAKHMDRSMKDLAREAVEGAQPKPQQLLAPVFDPRSILTVQEPASEDRAGKAATSAFGTTAPVESRTMPAISPVGA